MWKVDTNFGEKVHYLSSWGLSLSKGFTCLNQPMCVCALNWAIKTGLIVCHSHTVWNPFHITPHTVELHWLEHWWLVYQGYFEHILESLTKKYHSCKHYCIWDISGDFLFILQMVGCVYSVESLWWGDSNENTPSTFMWKKKRYHY